MKFTTMLSQFWVMLSTFFSAGEKIAKTVDNLATVAEEYSASYVDEARADRLAKIAAREQAADITAKAIEQGKTKASAKETAQA
jgi:hypothetical protein